MRRTKRAILTVSGLTIQRDGNPYPAGDRLARGTGTTLGDPGGQRIGENFAAERVDRVFDGDEGGDLRVEPEIRRSRLAGIAATHRPGEFRRSGSGWPMTNRR